MEKENMAQDAAAAQGADAREEKGATAAGLGKFKSVDALLSAYNSLEAEFTRRSQRLRELEGREKAEQAQQAQQAQQTELTEQTEQTGQTAQTKQTVGSDLSAPVAEERQDLDARVQRAVEACLAARPPYIMAGGGAGTVAPAPRVRSIEEAGRLAEDLFRKN